jgi:hypothetical protein
MRLNYLLYEKPFEQIQLIELAIYFEHQVVIVLFRVCHFGLLFNNLIKFYGIVYLSFFKVLTVLYL